MTRLGYLDQKFSLKIKKISYSLLVGKSHSGAEFVLGLELERKTSMKPDLSRQIMFLVVVFLLIIR